MLTNTTIPGTSLCWEYQWTLTPAKNTVTLSEFIPIHGLLDKAFRLAVKRSPDGQTAKLCCYVNNVEQTSHTVKAITCSYETKLVELRPVGDIKQQPFVVYSATVDEDVSVMTSKLCTYVFNLYLVGTAESYAIKRFDSLLGEQLWNATLSKHMTDVLFSVGDHSFFAHKFVVAARSPVMKSLFDSKVAGSRAGRVNIEDIHPDIFRQLLRFLYTGHLDTVVSSELRKAAEKFQIDTLSVLCRAIPASKVETEELLTFVTLLDVEEKALYEYKEERYFILTILQPVA